MRKSTEAKTTLAKLTVTDKTERNPNKSLIEIEKALKAAQAEVISERKARVQIEQTLTETRKELAAIQVETEHEHQVQIRRLSFIVRLTLDEHGQFERTQIEHVSSNRKQNFLSLDGEQLVAFMKASINQITSLDPSSQDP